MIPTHNHFRFASPELPIYVTYRILNGKHYTTPGDTYVARYFSVLLVYRGEVQTSIGGESIVLLPGDIRIFLKGDLHLFRCQAPDTRYLQVSFDPRLLSAFPKESYFYKRFTAPLRAGILDCPRLLHPGDPGYDEIFSQVDRLDVDREGQESYDATVLSVAISVCTALIPYCTTGQPASDSAEDVVRTCLQYMSQNGGKPITLEEMAALVHLHPNYLCTVFKKHTGRTVFEHLTRQRLRLAARRLQSTKKPVHQIAESCGFSSISFFNRKFRKIYGMTPLAYRKKYAHQPVFDDPLLL